MKHKCWALVLAAALLTGCAAQETPPQSSQKEKLTAKDLGREASVELDSGETASLHIGEEYSLYIPVEGWTLELESDDGILHDTWECDAEEDAKISIYHYAGVSFAVARDRYMRDCEYLFSCGLGGELGDPLSGTDDDGDLCQFMVAEGIHGTTYVIAWEYPADSAYEPTLTAMANTFELIE